MNSETTVVLLIANVFLSVGFFQTSQRLGMSQIDRLVPRNAARHITMFRGRS